MSPKLQKPDASVIHATALKVINNILIVGNKYGYVSTYKVLIVPLDESVEYNTPASSDKKSGRSSRLGGTDMNKYERKLDVASDMYGTPLIRL